MELIAISKYCAIGQFSFEGENVWGGVKGIECHGAYLEYVLWTVREFSSERIETLKGVLSFTLD